MHQNHLTKKFSDVTCTQQYWLSLSKIVRLRKTSASSFLASYIVAQACVYTGGGQDVLSCTSEIVGSGAECSCFSRLPSAAAAVRVFKGGMMRGPKRA